MGGSERDCLTGKSESEGGSSMSTPDANPPLDPRLPSSKDDPADGFFRPKPADKAPEKRPLCMRPHLGFPGEQCHLEHGHEGWHQCGPNVWPEEDGEGPPKIQAICTAILTTGTGDLRCRLPLGHLGDHDYGPDSVQDLAGAALKALVGTAPTDEHGNEIPSVFEKPAPHQIDPPPQFLETATGVVPNPEARVRFCIACQERTAVPVGIRDWTCGQCGKLHLIDEQGTLIPGKLAPEPWQSDPAKVAEAERCKAEISRAKTPMPPPIAGTVLDPAVHEKEGVDQFGIPGACSHRQVIVTEGFAECASCKQELDYDPVSRNWVPKLNPGVPCGEPHPHAPGVTCDKVPRHDGWHRNRAQNVEWMTGKPVDPPAQTPCCGRPIVAGNPPVYWNPGSGVVQCHMCGEVYEPREPWGPIPALTVDQLLAFLRRDIEDGAVITRENKEAALRWIERVMKLAGQMPPEPAVDLYGEKPTQFLTAEWRCSDGYICCGTLRIARWDFDTSPAPAVRETILRQMEWSLNTAYTWKKLADLKDAKGEANRTHNNDLKQEISTLRSRVFELANQRDHLETLLHDRNNELMAAQARAGMAGLDQPIVPPEPPPLTDPVLLLRGALNTVHALNSGLCVACGALFAPNGGIRSLHCPNCQFTIPDDVAAAIVEEAREILNECREAYNAFAAEHEEFKQREQQEQYNEPTDNAPPAAPETDNLSDPDSVKF